MNRPCRELLGGVSLSSPLKIRKAGEPVLSRCKEGRVALHDGRIYTDDELVVEEGYASFVSAITYRGPMELKARIKVNGTDLEPVPVKLALVNLEYNIPLVLSVGYQEFFSHVFVAGPGSQDPEISEK